MTNLERFKLITSFKKPDRCLRWYTLGFWPEIEEKWQKENGYPPNTDPMKYLHLEYPVLGDLPGNAGGGNIPYNPVFEEKIISSDEDTEIVQESTGIISRIYKKGRSMPQWLSFPVKTPEDWENIKFRINPDTHDCGENYDDLKLNHRNNNEPNGVFISGIYAFQRNLLGEENLAYAYHDMPEIIMDMSRHWLKYYSRVCEKLINDMRIDFVMFHEDMAYKTGPLIGPKLFMEYMTPFYKEMIRHLKGMKADVLALDCDGNLDILLPIFADLGINMTVPFEQAAGNDILKFREEFPDMVIWGGMDKRVLNGTKEEIKTEVYNKVSIMWEKGGFIPCIDHSTPPCPMENFMYYLELLESICE